MGLQGRMYSQAGGKAFKAPAETRPAAAAAATAPPARPSTPSAAPSAPVQHVLQDEVLAVLRGEHAAPLAQPEAAGLVRGHHPAPPLAVLLCEEARLRDGEGRVDELLAVHQRGVFGVADLRACTRGGGLEVRCRDVLAAARRLAAAAAGKQWQQQQAAATCSKRLRAHHAGRPVPRHVRRACGHNVRRPLGRGGAQLGRNAAQPCSSCGGNLWRLSRIVPIAAGRSLLLRLCCRRNSDIAAACLPPLHRRRFHCSSDFI